ncbi:MAG: peptidylprolyl isomerase [Flavobacteriales bacterium]
MRRIISVSILLVLGILSCSKKQDTIATPDSMVETVTEMEDKGALQGTPVGEKVLIRTSKGNMTVLLYNETPLHQANFLKLVNDGYYDSLLFHRVIKGFMVQGGDPKSKGAKSNDRLGSGNVGYTIPAEFNPSLIHKKGALAAARTNNPKKESSGCQYYIVQGKKSTDAELDRQQLTIQRVNPDFKYTDAQRETYKSIGGTPFLDMNYTVFGEVIEGLDVIDKIALEPTAPGDRPLVDIVMSMQVIK